MRQSIVTRLERVEAARLSRAIAGRDKAMTDRRVRDALAVMTLEDALGDLPPGYEGERAQAVIGAAFRAAH